MLLAVVGCRRRSTITVEIGQQPSREAPRAKSREVALPSDSFDPRVAWWRFANDYTAIGTYFILVLHCVVIFFSG